MVNTNVMGYIYTYTANKRGGMGLAGQTSVLGIQIFSVNAASTPFAIQVSTHTLVDDKVDI